MELLGDIVRLPIGVRVFVSASQSEAVLLIGQRKAPVQLTGDVHQAGKSLRSSHWSAEASSICADICGIFDDVPDEGQTETLL